MSTTVRDSLEAVGHGNTRGSSEYLQALETAFGALPPSLRTDFLENQARTHGNLSDALLARISPSISTKISGLLTDEFYSPYTSYLLPYKYVDNNASANITWDELHFSEGIATPVQSEGVPRLHTSERVSRGDKMIRRGAALTIDSEFYQTPEGREMFGMQLEQLAAVTQRANEMDVLLALLRSGVNSRHAWQLGGNFNFNTDTADLRQRLEADIQLFGLVNKTPDSRGLRNVITRFRTIMERNGVEPDSVVLPPFLLNYYYMNKPDLWNHSSAGDEVSYNRAMATRTGDPSGVDTVRKMDGMNVVDTHLYRTTTRSQHDPVDMLTAPRQVGEFAIMSSKYLGDTDYVVKEIQGASGPVNITRLKSGVRDLRMYDEKQDRMELVRYSDALKKSLAFNRDGSFRASGWWAFSGANNTRFRHLANWNSIKEHIPEPLRAEAGAVKLTRDGCLTAHAEGIYVPLDFALCRPYATYNVSSMIIMKAGEDTGQTFVGWNDFQMTANTMQKMIAGSYTFLSKAIVYNDENVTVANDVFIQSYIKGFDLTFISEEDQFAEIQNLGGLFDKDGSILSIPIAPCEDLSAQNIIDIRGKNVDLSPLQTQTYTEIASQENAFFSSHVMVERRLQIDDLTTHNITTDSKDYESLMFKGNTICAHGNYDVREGGRWRPIRNKGSYLGNIVYDGVGQSRDATNHVPLAMEFGVAPSMYELPS